MVRLVLIFLCLFSFFTAFESSVHAKFKKKKESAESDFSGESSSSSEGGSGSFGGRTKGLMYADLLMQYVKPTSSTDPTDSSARFSIGGMFDTAIGLDVLGQFEIKSRSFLIGSDLRFAPTNWLFFKGGFGAYSDKKTRELKATPIAGGGILAPLGNNYYFTSELSYFQVNSHSNIAIGAGLGTVF